MRRENPERQGLSARERQVLGLLADGKTPAEIASRLGLSIKTVQAYCARAKEKLGARNLAQLIYTAILLCKADMAQHFNELLNGVGSIEMRYFDLRGKLIAKQRLECTVLARQRRKQSRKNN